MSSSSERAAVVRELVEDVLVGWNAGLVSYDELMDLRDMIARVQRRLAAKLTEQQGSE